MQLVVCQEILDLLEDFFQTAIGLKNIQRKGWKNKLKIDHPESVADHSYSMTVIAMVLADLKGLDTKKIMKMSLLHDLAESQTGDYLPNEIPKQQKTKLENNIMKKILATLPTNLANEYDSIWKEFQLQETKESKFLHEIDRLEMALQAKAYVNEGHPKDLIQSFLDTADIEIKNEQLRKILTNLFNEQKYQ